MNAALEAMILFSLALVPGWLALHVMGRSIESTVRESLRMDDDDLP